jgi:hypothetical protein
MKATVRVGNGSGVVIRNGSNTLIATAQHVVEGDGPHRIRWPEGFADETVLKADKAADVAVLAALPKLDTLALDMDLSPPQVGDNVTAAGFPDGWNESHAIVARGVIAGTGTENWVNLDGTWGHSGRPLCRFVGAKPVVVGILLGRAGAVNQTLAGLQKRLDEQRAIAERGPLSGIFDDAIDLDLQGIAGALWIAKQTADLMEAHFRTGFLRFAAAADVRQLLA